MEKAVRLIRDLLKCTAKVNVSSVGGTPAEILDLINIHFHGIAQQIARENFFATVSSKIGFGLGQVCLMRDFLHVHYLITCISETPTYLVIGPCLAEPFSDTAARD